MKINKHIQDIMDKNGIKLTDVKLFREEDGEGHYIDTEISFEELLNATDINDAVLYWYDINPYSEENNMENNLKYGLITKDMLEEYLEDEMITKEEYEKYMEKYENGRFLF